jgi:hypothetical protein
MSYRLAKAQIVTMLEAIPSYRFYRPDVYGAGLEHDPTLLYSQQPGKSRRFGVQSPSGGTYAQATGTDSRRMTSLLEIVIEYPAKADAYTLDDVIWSDYEAIREYALLDVSTWGRPSSTIITTVIEQAAIEADTEDIIGDDGEIAARRLTIRFPLVHQGVSL